MSSSNMPPEPPAATSSQHALGAVEDLVRSYGAHSRGHREAIALLVEGTTLAEVVRATAMPRRLIEQLMRALGDDLVPDGERLRIRPGRARAYREAFDLGNLSVHRLGLPADDLVTRSDNMLHTVAGIVNAAPKPKKALDHVPATPETALRRAYWMDGTYDLSGATLLCVGDHDLTSIVTCLVNPGLRVVVVDIDEELLAYIDDVARARGLNIETAYSDFRVGLPDIARGCADLIFTDPPYTPEGVRLFLARGLEGLRDREHGRLLMAYGFGSHHPGLGFNVQQAVADLSLVYEAILPHFNRYIGAQAVGSASDLYVCRPTARTWKSLDRITRDTVNIYTHGSQSLEAGSVQGDDAVRLKLWQYAEDGGLSVSATVLSPSGREDVPLLELPDVFEGRAQGQVSNARESAVVADLSDDPGTWAYRLLLSLNARRIVVAVPNRHPDITNKEAQDSIREAFRGKWDIIFRRSMPDSAHALIEANEPDTTRQAPDEIARRLVLGGASRKLENAWRDALVKASRATGTPMTKNDARERIAATGVERSVLDRQLVAAPRHVVGAVLDAVSKSVT